MYFQPQFFSHHNDASKVCLGRFMTIEKKKCKGSKLKGSLRHRIIQFYFLPAFRVDISNCRLLPFLRDIIRGDHGCMWFHCFFVHPNIFEVKSSFLDSNSQGQECIFRDFVDKHLHLFNEEQKQKQILYYFVQLCNQQRLLTIANQGSTSAQINQNGKTRQSQKMFGNIGADLSLNLFDALQLQRSWELELGFDWGKMIYMRQGLRLSFKIE